MEDYSYAGEGHPKRRSWLKYAAVMGVSVAAGVLCLYSFQKESPHQVVQLPQSEPGLKEAMESETLSKDQAISSDLLEQDDAAESDAIEMEEGKIEEKGEETLK